jgi:anti-sigma B factor antagonist
VITTHLEREGVAVVKVFGDHDLSSKQRLTDILTLAGLVCDVVVDLSDCTFMDTTVVRTLRLAHRSQGARGLRLELVIPPEATAVSRFVDLTGLTRVLPIHATRSAALVPTQSEDGTQRLAA